MKKYIRRNWLGILLTLAFLSSVYSQISRMGTINGLPLVWLPIIIVWLWWREDHKEDKQEKSCDGEATPNAAQEKIA